MLSWKTLGLVLGVGLFLVITSNANPALAQLFDTVESEANSIFGERALSTLSSASCALWCGSQQLQGKLAQLAADASEGIDEANRRDRK